jgi:hypothetical protein
MPDKRPKPNTPLKKGHRIVASPTTPPGGTNNQTPVFDFHHICKKFSITNCPPDFQSAFARRLYEISQLTWAELQRSSHRGIGTEMMPVDQLNAPLPSTFTADAKRLTVIRFYGQGRILGHRDLRTFMVLFVEHDLSLYDHGS